MHDHDFDLIAACADGSASPDELERGRVAMSACSQCAEEYRAQREVLEMLRKAPAARMTDLERASLHRAIASALPEPRAGWFTRFAPRIAAVAAGLAVVGLASVTMLRQTGQDVADTVNDIAAVEESADRQLAPMEEMDGDASVQESAGGADMPLDEAAEAPSFLTGAAIEEIDASTLAEYAGRLLEDDAASGNLEQATEVCGAVLPEDAEALTAGEVSFEGSNGFVFVYRVDLDTKALVVSVEACEPIAEITLGG